MKLEGTDYETLKLRLCKLVLKGRGFGIEEDIECEAQYLADRFADKDSEIRWTIVACGLFIFLIAVVAFW